MFNRHGNKRGEFYPVHPVHPVHPVKLRFFPVSVASEGVWDMPFFKLCLKGVKFKMEQNNADK
jgi:hypothetical protein